MGQPATTDRPLATDQPQPSFGPLPDPYALLEPLPEPELETVDDIVEAMFQPGMAAVSVVSMLDQLDIGTYHDDGSPIRVGAETSDADVYLFESEVRGLIHMVEQQDQTPWLDFTDFHAALAELGLQSSAAELAQAYNDAYAAQPDAPITRFVQAQAFIDPQAQLAPLGVWLMFLEGWCPTTRRHRRWRSRPVGSSPQGSRRSVAGGNVRRLNWASNPGAERVWRTCGSWPSSRRSSIFVDVIPGSVHEGHGSPGCAGERARCRSSRAAVASRRSAALPDSHWCQPVRHPGHVAVGWRIDRPRHTLGRPWRHHLDGRFGNGEPSPTRRSRKIPTPAATGTRSASRH